MPNSCVTSHVAKLDALSPIPFRKALTMHIALHHLPFEPSAFPLYLLYRHIAYTEIRNAKQRPPIPEYYQRKPPQIQPEISDRNQFA
jgi:hypothetical protein